MFSPYFSLREFIITSNFPYLLFSHLSWLNQEGSDSKMYHQSCNVIQTKQHSLKICLLAIYVSCGFMTSSHIYTEVNNGKKPTLSYQTFDLSILTYDVISYVCMNHTDTQMKLHISNVMWTSSPNTFHVGKGDHNVFHML